MGSDTVVQARHNDADGAWDVWEDVADGIMRIADAEARIGALTGIPSVWTPVTATVWHGNVPSPAGESARDQARARVILATLRDIVYAADEDASGWAEGALLARIESAYDASAERFAAFAETLETVRP